ncbi:hypothetical protein Lal_00038891 [Lupinus albus]|uniref:Putative START-like domain, Bet v I type allergen n=1 Tax=Lupinus albus TaxID=3870 RepID=A0A6A4NR50_LUPAL|nr:putative START-like domain, Bet v I type allergen [Lupinus albus]KAF1882245.1 hypothetical protein Lal_00038891 [Lupinus albus]
MLLLYLCVFRIYDECFAGGQSSYVLHKIDAIDEANLRYDYSIVGGTGLDESLEKITFESKILGGPDGGSIGKINAKFHTKGDLLSDTVRDEAKFKGIGLFKAVEGYVLANPQQKIVYFYYFIEYD